MAEGDRERRADQRHLREAIRIASDSVRHGGGPFGAVVVRGGEVVGRGRNRVTADNDPTAHAEIEAIRDACRRLGAFRLDGCHVYCSSEPCPMCMAALYWARPARVVYAADKEVAADAGFDDVHITEELAKPEAERRLPFVRRELEGAGEPFRLWEAKEDRVEY